MRKEEVEEIACDGWVVLTSILKTYSFSNSTFLERCQNLLV